MLFNIAIVLYFVDKTYASITLQPFTNYKFERLEGLNNRICKDDDKVFERVTSSDAKCALNCLIIEECMSVFNGADGGKCFGCSTAYNASVPGILQEMQGNVHYQIYPSCEDGWIGYLRSCYKMSSHTHFPDGAAECEDNGAHAVYIESSVENEFLKEWIRSDATTWAWYIGITLVNGEWRYYDTNQLVQFTDFKVSEQGGKGCALFFDGYGYQWAEFECEHPTYGFPTICENNVL